MRAYVKDSTKLATKKTKFILAVITGGTTKYLQTLDIGVICAFKVTLQIEWDSQMTSSEKSLPKTILM